MSDYTITNLKEVEDLAPKFGMSPAVEARFARTALECERSGLSYFKLAPGQRVPFGHRHTEQEETYVVVSGSGRIKIDDDVRDLSRWDVVRVVPTATRALEAGPDGIEYVAFGAGPTSENEAEMVPGWWTDEAG